MTNIRNLTPIGLLVLLLGTGQALADCYYNGKPVPEGTQIGSVVCQNGNWVEKQ